MGIGSSVHMGELEALASQPSYSHVFQFKSRSSMPAGNDLKIALALCSGKRDKTLFFTETLHNTAEKPIVNR